MSYWIVMVRSGLNRKKKRQTGEEGVEIGKIRYRGGRQEERNEKDKERKREETEESEIDKKGREEGKRRGKRDRSTK
jgi:hypothetical protein